MSAIVFQLVLPVFYYLFNVTTKKIRAYYMGLMLHFCRTELLVCTVGSAAGVALKQIWSQRQEFRRSGRTLAQVAWVEGVTQPS